MSKKIIFDGTSYNVDETLLSSAKEALKTHLASKLNGTGAVIRLDGISYNVDANKLAAAKADFVNNINDIDVEAGQDVVIYDGLLPNLTYREGTHRGTFPNFADKLVEGNIYKVIVSAGDFYLEFEEPCYWSDGYNAMQIYHEYQDFVYFGTGTIRIYFDPEDTTKTLNFKDHSGIYNLMGQVSEINIKIVELAAAIEGKLITINDTTYILDTEKTEEATSQIAYVLRKNKGQPQPGEFVPGLYETGAVALYNEQGKDAVEGMLITSWDDLVDSGAIVVENNEITIGVVSPEELPELNEYGFYYGVPYTAWGWSYVLHEDGSVEGYCNGVLDYGYPPGTATYSAENGVYFVEWDWTLKIVPGGKALREEWENDGVLDYEDYKLGSVAQLSGDLIMPDDGTITAISDYGFSYQSNLTGITIPNSVTELGEYAFHGCTSLKSAPVIPEGITSLIGTFAGCKLIVDAPIIPESVTELIATFSGCASLKFAPIIPEGVISIGVATFEECTSLINVTIPKGVTSIGERAFEQCTSLTDIIIPEGVTSIGYCAFTDCSNLTDVYYPGTEEQWHAIEIDGSNYELLNATIHYNYGTVTIGGGE